MLTAVVIPKNAFTTDTGLSATSCLQAAYQFVIMNGESAQSNWKHSVGMLWNKV